MAELLRIVLGEFQGRKHSWELLYHSILKELWSQGLEGATVLRSYEGLGEKDDFRAFIVEDTPFNNLPIIIEAVDEASRIQAVTPRLRSQIPHGMILSFPVIRLFKEEFPLDLSNTFMMKIFIKENSS
ncbi:DUF190 domain-containing protein [Caenibacillus caldisaponilyticus]|uniref:DUF190 domain-containing protein n=1 Tax=Caenibacillus caldisaponilyticus TaxID=1674942 RepID=UPI0009885D65|nr:DUF190 domain-containing protein [Caenibacillus caldisaponilyticus]